MAQEHINNIDQAVEQIIRLRRDRVNAMAAGGLANLAQFIEYQTAIETLQRARADEESRLPSVYDTRGILEV